MDINALVNEIKQRNDYDRVGMILCHNGVVRGTSRDGRQVSGLRIKVNWDELAQVIASQKQRPGIIDIAIKIDSDRDLKVGDDVMALVVAGDIRDNVLSVLSDTLNIIKTSVTAKTEFFIPTSTKDG